MNAIVRTEQDFDREMSLLADRLSPNIYHGTIGALMIGIAASPGHVMDSRNVIFCANHLERKFLSDSPSKDDKQRFVRQVLRDAVALSVGEMKVVFPE